MKRMFDIVLSFAGLLLLSPLFIVLAVAIKLETNGGVFYRGIRVGQYGRCFKIFKFRSMVQGADMLGCDTTGESDIRVTRVGRVIRRYKLDEISQLINVLCGDMSIVGPRPQVQWAVDCYTDEERRVLRLKPGITDWASIRFHDEGEIIAKSGIADPDEAYMRLIHDEKTRLQLKYLRERSFAVDIRIIYETILQLFCTRMRRRDA